MFVSLHESGSIQSTKYGNSTEHLSSGFPTQLALILDSVLFLMLRFLWTTRLGVQDCPFAAFSGIPGMDDFNSCDTTFLLDM